jgi:hypothetical protein
MQPTTQVASCFQGEAGRRSTGASRKLIGRQSRNRWSPTQVGGRTRKAKSEDTSSEDESEVGWKAEPMDAVSGASRKVAPRRSRRGCGRRKPGAGPKAETEDGSPAQAGGQSEGTAGQHNLRRRVGGWFTGEAGGRRFRRKSEAEPESEAGECSSRRSWKLAAGTADGWMADASQSLIAGPAGGPDSQRKTEAGREGTLEDL